MNFFDLLNVRESCRNYADRPVEQEKLQAVIEAGRLAPSACNSQPWSFVVINTPENAAKAAECIQKSGANAFTSKAPAFIIITEEYAHLAPRVLAAMDSQTFAQIDLGIVTAHLTLAASELGLSTCILGLFDEDATKEAFEIPADRHVRLILSVGYSADEAPRKKTRKPVDEIARFL